MGNISPSSAVPTFKTKTRTIGVAINTMLSALAISKIIIQVFSCGCYCSTWFSSPPPFFPGEPSPTRREAVKKKTAEYLMRAEQISSLHLRGSMGQGSTQTVVSGANVYIRFSKILNIEASVRVLKPLGFRVKCIQT